MEFSMEAKTDSQLKVVEMILKAPRLHQNSIDQALSDEDLVAIDEFENKWSSFLSSNPDLLPPGKKLKNCLEFQSQLEEVEVSNQMVKMELQRQLDFFSNSKNQLEANFTRAMEEAALMQQEVSRTLNKEIDDIAVADQILSKTLPWEHFFDNLDSLTENNYVSDGMTSDGEQSSTYSRGLKPSKQAMYLAQNIDQGEIARAAMEGKSSALLLRAFKIDNALLKAELKMMQQEIGRLERTTKAQKDLAKFLSEYNIWGLLSKSSGGTATVASTASTFRTRALQKPPSNNPLSPSRVAVASRQQTQFM
ncbi:hypothetical protein IV203_037281 [Nitzschia inconspicua]|uniref:Uncharacterized protein n=1 Tax=Nitzschia inconspicua TaxID=303405 RepID=A0A9K3Q0V2_9STRA|nr:hypothetical protein IV203_037281 [Nitzschia inconspicua]